jgi:hypothetical protein
VKWATRIHHREPPLGGVAIHRGCGVRIAWTASSQALLAMTAGG